MALSPFFYLFKLWFFLALLFKVLDGESAAHDTANTVPNPTGPANPVKVGCMFIRLGGGAGNATDTGAVVNITGPN